VKNKETSSSLNFHRRKFSQARGKEAYQELVSIDGSISEVLIGMSLSRAGLRPGCLSFLNPNIHVIFDAQRDGAGRNVFGAVHGT
jgi:hypothetical protein